MINLLIRSRAHGQRDTRATAADRRRYAPPRRFPALLAGLMLTGLLICPGAALANPTAQLTVAVTGAGSVSASRAFPPGVPCTSPLATPTGTAGITCFFGVTGVSEGGEFVDLTARVPDGWAFDHWTNVETGSNPCTGIQTAARCELDLGSCGVIICDLQSVSVRAAFKDVSAPETVIDAGPSGTVVDAEGRAAFEFASPDRVARLECALDAADFARCSSPVRFSHLSDGVHRFVVRAVDPSGLVDQSPAERTWQEETPPDTRISAGPGEGARVADQRATLSLVSSESNSTFECQLDGGQWRGCPTPNVLDELADGPHRFAARATDRRGITDPTPAVRSWSVDTTPPDTAITTGLEPGLLTNSRSAKFELASEPGARFECSLDGAPFAGCPSLATFASLGIGGHRFDARAIDDVGNADPTPASLDWSITADLDRDGFVLPGDCDDKNRAVHPGARDIPQNGVDENCSRGDAAFPSNPTGFKFAFARRGVVTRVTLLRLARVPRGAQIRVTCRDRRRSCPLRSRTIRPRGGQRRVVLTRLFRGANLRRGAVIEITTTKTAMLGQVDRLTVRTGRDPHHTEHCLDPRNARRVRC